MDSASCSQSSIPEVGKRGRKWLRLESGWKRKRKIQKDSGEAYATYTGEAKAAKKVLNLTCKCAHLCPKKLDEEEQKRIFGDFYKLGNHDTQNQYLLGLLRKEAVKRKTRGTTTQRSNTITYQIRGKNGTYVQVCKTSFCDVHAIGKRRVEGLAEKLVSGELPAIDGRGKHSNRRHTIPEERKDKAREHIKSKPWRESHHSRTSNRKREYLSEGLSIARMHQMYLDKYEPGAKQTGAAPQVRFLPLNHSLICARNNPALFSTGERMAVPQHFQRGIQSWLRVSTQWYMWNLRSATHRNTGLQVGVWKGRTSDRACITPGNSKSRLPVTTQWQSHRERELWQCSTYLWPDAKSASAHANPQLNVLLKTDVGLQPGHSQLW